MKRPNLANWKSWLKLFFGLPLTFISFAFIFQIIYSSWGDVSSHLTKVDIPVVLLGIFFMSSFFLLKAVSWSKVLETLGHKVPFRQGFFLLSFSDTKRYIPGNIFAVAARVNYFEKYGLSKKLLLAAQVVELLVLLASGAILSIPGVIFLGDDIASLRLPFGIENELETWGIPVFILLLLFVLGGLLYFISKRLLRLNAKISYGALLDAFFLGMLAWVFFGVGNYLVVTSFFPLPIENILGLVSFFVFSWLIGFLSFFTPMGLGVRELVITLGLGGILGGGAAAASAVVARVFLILAELSSLFLSYVIKKDSKCLLYKYPWQYFVLGISVVFYSFYFLYVSFLKHVNFLTGKYDLGNMDQTVWNTLNGRIFILTDPTSTHVMSRLGIHSDFLLIFLAPFYLIWNDPRMLLLIQTLVIAAGGVFVYLLANYLLKNRTLSLVFAISYLLNFWVQRQNLFDFHAVALATTFLLATFYFLLKKRYILFSVFLLLSVLSKENAFFISFFFGGYLFLKGYRKVGALVAIASFAAFYLLVAHIIPEYRPQVGGHFGIGYFEALGNTPAEVITTGLLRPDLTASIFYKNEGLTYVFQTLLPTGFLSLASPIFLLFASGEYFINIMSENRWLRTIFFHYGALIVPFVYISSIYGAKFLMSVKRIKISPKFLVYYILIFALFSTWMYGVLPGAKGQSVGVFSNPYKEREEVSRVLSHIPKEYSITSSNTLAAHLTRRQNSHVLPKAKDSDVAAILLRPPYIGSSEAQHMRILDEYMSNFEYSLVYRTDEFYVFSKDEYGRELELLLAGNGVGGREVKE